MVRVSSKTWSLRLFLWPCSPQSRCMACVVDNPQGSILFQVINLPKTALHTIWPMVKFIIPNRMDSDALFLASWLHQFLPLAATLGLQKVNESLVRKTQAREVPQSLDFTWWHVWCTWGKSSNNNNNQIFGSIVRASPLTNQSISKACKYSLADYLFIIYLNMDLFLNIKYILIIKNWGVSRIEGACGVFGHHNRSYYFAFSVADKKTLLGIVMGRLAITCSAWCCWLSDGEGLHALLALFKKQPLGTPQQWLVYSG